MMWRLEQGKFFFVFLLTRAASSVIPLQGPNLHWYQQFAQPSILSVPYTFPQSPSPNTWIVNNAFCSSAQVDDSFQHAQFTTLTNHDQSNSSNGYELSQASFVIPSSYALKETDLLQETDLLVPSTGADQFQDISLPACNGYGPAPTSYVPLLSPSTSAGMAIDATAEVPTVRPRPSSMSERSNESLPDLHGPIQSSQPNNCQECTQSFPSSAELERHAKFLHHAAFKCTCGKAYARLDNLKRHWNQTPKFPCPHCTRYTGANAFPREDHLTQHLRTYHRINNPGDNKSDSNSHRLQLFCTWPNCTHQQRSFGIRSQYTEHLRRIHNYSPFLCLVQGCVKVGGKGYFRESDLAKHSKEVHSIED